MMPSSKDFLFLAKQGLERLADNEVEDVHSCFAAEKRPLPETSICNEKGSKVNHGKGGVLRKNIFSSLACLTCWPEPNLAKRHTPEGPSRLDSGAGSS